MMRLTYIIWCVVLALCTSCGGDSSGGSSGIPSGPVNPTPTTIAVTGVSISKTTLALVEGESETLSATVAPSNATNKKVSWSSNKTTVAAVDDNGKVTAVAAGTATITVKTIDGNKTATCIITVAEPDPTDIQGGATHEGYSKVNMP
ncbi:MAG: Ig domain-containing protein [Bacteroidaceae bacterium]|nr:Ig domain-containing protein [Bacteroidaceae bacterium]